MIARGVNISTPVITSADPVRSFPNTILHDRSYNMPLFRGEDIQDRL